MGNKTKEYCKLEHWTPCSCKKCEQRRRQITLLSREMSKSELGLSNTKRIESIKYYLEELKIAEHWQKEDTGVLMTEFWKRKIKDIKAGIRFMKKGEFR